MKIAKQVIFRRITGADFFNIYKAPGAEAGGGGQSYIDIDTSGVSLLAWYNFFAPIVPKKMAKNYPAWTVNIASIGLGKQQNVTIGQRRPTSVSIRSQKINSRSSNRIFSWHPKYGGFPVPTKPPTSSTDPAVTTLIEGLVIFLVRDSTGDIWAGWYKRASPNPDWIVDPRLKPMFVAGEGFIDLAAGIPFDETNVDWPFGLTGQSAHVPIGKKDSAAIAEKNDEKLLSALFDVDEIENPPPKVKAVIQTIRVRNARAVKQVKELYGGVCQISGDKYVFVKADGVPYVEAHHLVPLGDGGADLPQNLIVVSAHVHKMLHYANVSKIDLSQITDNKLSILINLQEYTITWHPKHAEVVVNAAKKAIS